MVRQYKERHNLSNPTVAVTVFRDWCLEMGMVPEHATVEDLDRFGMFLSGDGYTSKEIQNCKYILFTNL